MSLINRMNAFLNAQPQAETKHVRGAPARTDITDRLVMGAVQKLETEHGYDPNNAMQLIKVYGLETVQGYLRVFPDVEEMVEAQGKNVQFEHLLPVYRSLVKDLGGRTLRETLAKRALDPRAPRYANEKGYDTIDTNAPTRA